MTKDDVLRLDLSKISGPKTNSNTISFGQRFKNFFGSKSGKWTTGIATALALTGIGYSVYMNYKNKIANNKPETEHLSAII